MSASMVTIWNCTISEDWSEKSFAQKLTSLYAATFTAQVEADMRLLTGRTTDWIFVSPEYTFAQTQVDEAAETSLKAALTDITKNAPSMVLVAGTIAVKFGSRQKKARNTCYVYHNGNEKSCFGKRISVGEVSAESGLTFAPGAGKGCFTLNGASYGIEICKDATVGQLSSNVDMHIVVGQGVGTKYIVNRASKYQIVADMGGYGVFDYKHGKKEIKPYNQESSLGEMLYYYSIET